MKLFGSLAEDSGFPVCRDGSRGDGCGTCGRRGVDVLSAGGGGGGGERVYGPGVRW